MKNFQANLLITLALGLCVLCATQWYEQTVQRDEIITLNGLVYSRNITIQDATNSVAILNHQIAHMDERLTEIKAVAATNAQVIATQKAELTMQQFANKNLTNEVAQYKVAVDALGAKLKDAYADMEKQNDAVTNLVAQRDDLVKKYNDEVKDRNDVVTKYNDLASKIQKSQSDQK